MLVQHATLGPPFINTESICSSNAGPGFLQIHSHPDPEEKSFYWPGPDSLDLRSCDPSEAYVSTHLVKDSLGWSTVASPVHGFLVGYLCDASRYPWLHIWQGIREDRLWAKGIEFGNTGLGDNFSLNDRYAMSTFGRRHAAQMQKQDSILCEYFLFAAGLPDGFQGVNQVTLKGQQIHIDFQRN